MKVQTREQMTIVIIGGKRINYVMHHRTFTFAKGNRYNIWRNVTFTPLIQIGFLQYAVEWLFNKCIIEREEFSHFTWNLIDSPQKTSTQLKIVFTGLLNIKEKYILIEREI